MKIVAVDTGKNAGFAIFEGEMLDLNRKEWWTTKVSVSESTYCFPDDIHRGERYIGFINSINDLVKDGADAIIFEQVLNYSSVDASNSYGGFYACLAMVSVFYKIPLIGISVTEVKKRFTSKGDASKSDMLEAASRIYNMDIKNDNVADALGILYTFIEGKRYNKNFLRDINILRGRK